MKTTFCIRDDFLTNLSNKTKLKQFGFLGICRDGNNMHVNAQSLHTNIFMYAPCYLCK